MPPSDQHEQPTTCRLRRMADVCDHVASDRSSNDTCCCEGRKITRTVACAVYCRRMGAHSASSTPRHDALGEPGSGCLADAHYRCGWLRVLLVGEVSSWE